MTAGGNPQAVAGLQMSQNQMMTGPQMAGVAANQMVTGQQMPGAPQMMFSPRGPSGVQLVPGPQTAVADQAAAVGDPESGLRPGSGSLAQPAMMLGTCTPGWRGPGCGNEPRKLECRGGERKGRLCP